MVRRVIAEKTGVKAGDLAFILVRLPGGTSEDARITIWERDAGGDFAPYVKPELMETLQDGRPSFLTPLGIRLNESHPKHKFTLEVDRQVDLRVVQETDTYDDQVAKARIIRHGKTQQALRRFVRDAVRTLRSPSRIIDRFRW